MNLNTTLTKIVGILVALIITLSVAVPIISNLGGDSTTIYGQNTPLTDIRYADATEGEHVVTLETDGVFTVDGVRYQTSRLYDTVLQTDSMYIQGFSGVFHIGIISTNTSYIVENTGTSTITFQNGSAHIVTESSPTNFDVNREYNWLLLPVPDGDYCIADISESYLGPEQSFYIGYDSTGSIYGDFYTYRYSDGQMTGVGYDGDTDQFITEDVVVSTDVDEHGMIRITDITPLPASPAHGVFPLEYGVFSEQTDDPVMDLIQIVPLLLIVGLVIATIATIVMYRTND